MAPTSISAIAARPNHARVCLIGVRSENVRTHNVMAILICTLQLVAVFEVFPKLGF